MEDSMAIVGIACRFPGGKSAHQYWNNLTQGKSCVVEVPASRWSVHDHYAPEFEPNRSVSKWGGFVEDFEHFDAAFFGISPREAQLMDPQQRVMLELAIQCVEDGGYSVESFRGSSTGVFVGVCNFDFKEMLEKYMESLEGHMATGTYTALIPNRVSFFMDLKGPSLPVDTACSSSLVALNLAVNAIRNGECEAALVGGVSYLSSHTYFVSFSQAGMLSPNGLCRTFDARADGYVRGEGAGLVLVKPLARALEDNDLIYAVVNSVAVNHGGSVPTITSPSAYAQSKVVFDAMMRAELSPDQVSHIEAHGTGTPKGDPIEVNGLKRAYAALAKQFGVSLAPESCMLGSAKTHIGHLESASGIAGVIKILLSMRHRYLPPLVHFSELNPRIKLAGSPFAIPVHGCDWLGSEPRRAGVSSFGFGGVNAHAVLSEYPSVPKNKPHHDRRTQLLTLSAHTAGALRDYALLLQKHIERHPDLDLSDLAYSMTRRTERRHRLATLFVSRDDLLQKLVVFCSSICVPDCMVRAEAEVNATSDATVSLQNTSLASLAQHWVHGGKVDWASVYPHSQHSMLPLPPYPFQHQHYFPKELSRQHRRQPPSAVPEKNEQKQQLWHLESHWQRIGPLRESLSPGHQRTETMVCLLTDAHTTKRILTRVSDCQMVVLPVASDNERGEHWVQWLWRTIAALHEGIKQQAQKSLVLLSNQADWHSATLFALLRSVDKEFQLPCHWYQWRVEHNELILNTLSALLALPVTETAALRLVLSESQLVVEQLQYRCRAFFPAIGTRLANQPVCLITGGAGGIGLILAKHLVTHYGANVILVGRTPRAADSFDHLLQGSGSITYCVTDCTSLPAMQGRLDQVLQRFGQLDVVVHAAGAIKDKSLFFKTMDDVNGVVAGKVLGCEVLDALTAELPLKHFIVCSSITGLLGNPGQTDYAAANAYLGTFADHRNALVAAGKRFGHTIAVHWPYWREGGMQIADELVNMLRYTMGIEPMTNTEGIQVFEHALATHSGQLCVVSGVKDDIERCICRTVPTSEEQDQKATGHAGPDDIEAMITGHIAEVTGLSIHDINTDAQFAELGIDSISMQALARDLSAALGLRIGNLTLTQHNSIRKLHDYVAPQVASVSTTAQAPARQQGATLTHSLSANLSISSALIQPARSGQMPSTPGLRRLAITGLDLQFSGCDNWQDAWAWFGKGPQAQSYYPEHRWSLLPDELKRGFTRHDLRGFFLKDGLTFDNSLFRMANREAMLTDPQQRLLLQSVWRAIESAGYRQDEFATSRTAVLVCLDAIDYAEIVSFDARVDEFTAHSSTPYLAANRISHFFNLQGPSETFNTACSSVYGALEKAADLIDRGIVEQAVIAACQLNLLPRRFQILAQKQLICADADIAPFDRRAHGFLRGEAVGCLIVKSVNSAQEAGDHILATIEASASWHAGRGSSLTTPNPLAHNKAMQLALTRAGSSAHQLAYVEAHGTASKVGDASEVDALCELLDQSRPPRPCILGTLKADLGHLEVCSGIAAIAKVVLAMRHGEVPGIAGLKEPLDALDPQLLSVSDTSQPLPDQANYLVGLHAYGLGGVSAFVLLRPWQTQSHQSRRATHLQQWFLISANSKPSLREYAQKVATQLTTISPEQFSDMIQCFMHHRGNFSISPGKLENSKM